MSTLRLGREVLLYGLLAAAMAGCPQEVPESNQFGAGGADSEADAGAVADTATDTATVTDTVTDTDTATVTDTATATVTDTATDTDTGPCACNVDSDCGPSPDPCATFTCSKCACSVNPMVDGTGCGGANSCEGGKCTAGAAPWAVAIAAGSAHTCVVHGSGGVSCWGRNSQGQIGKGGPSSPKDYETKAVVAVGLQNVTAVASRNNHTCALAKDGQVRCWGDNFRGEIGNGSNTDDVFAPTLALALNGVVSVATGSEFSLAIRDDKSLWGWGHAGYYKLLDPTLSNANKPKQIGKSYGVMGLTGVCGGNMFACGIWPDFTVKCWGQGGNGEIGGGNYKYNYQAKSPEAVSNIGSIAELACGDSHVCAREASGTVWCWGKNLEEQVSDGSAAIAIATPMQPAGVGKLTAIALGQGHSCGLDGAGDVVCWGANDHGQLGIEGKTVGNIHTTTLNPKGIAIAAGFDHTCAVRADGAVLCWGANNYGQLGDGKTEDSPAPVVVSPSGG